MAPAVVALLSYVTLVGGYSQNSSGLITIPGDISDNETTVDLSDNHITYVESSLLPSRLEKFDFNRNKISSFPDLTKVAATLKTLDFSQNNIAMIDPPLLNALSNLEKLNLGGNKLTLFPDVPGPGSSLTYLSLTDNNLKSFPSLIQIGASLQALYLRNNHIGQQDFRMHLFADQLTVLYLHNNNIGRVPLLHGEVKASIRTLGISSNGITAITEQEMKGFISLKTLYVDGNSFTTFPDLSAVANTLTQLYLSYNKKPILASTKLLKKFSKITRINMQGTEWKKLPNFCHVKFPSSPMIHLAGDLNCDCHAVWLKLLTARPSTVIIQRNQVCRKPDEHQNKDWKHMTIPQLKCEGLYRESLSTAIDVENYYCASAPVVNRIRVRNAAVCYMKCMHEASCIYFNVMSINGTSDVMCSVTDISKSDLSQPSNFTATGAWYSVD